MSATPPPPPGSTARATRSSKRKPVGDNVRSSNEASSASSAQFPPTLEMQQGNISVPVTQMPPEDRGRRSSRSTAIKARETIQEAIRPLGARRPTLQSDGSPRPPAASATTAADESRRSSRRGSAVSLSTVNSTEHVPLQHREEMDRMDLPKRQPGVLSRQAVRALASSLMAKGEGETPYKPRLNSLGRPVKGGPGYLPKEFREIEPLVVPGSPTVAQGALTWRVKGPANIAAAPSGAIARSLRDITEDQEAVSTYEGLDSKENDQSASNDSFQSAKDDEASRSKMITVAERGVEHPDALSQGEDFNAKPASAGRASTGQPTPAPVKKKPKKKPKNVFITPSKQRQIKAKQKSRAEARAAEKAPPRMLTEPEGPNTAFEEDFGPTRDEVAQAADFMLATALGLDTPEQLRFIHNGRGKDELDAPAGNAAHSGASPSTQLLKEAEKQQQCGAPAPETEIEARRNPKTDIDFTDEEVISVLGDDPAMSKRPKVPSSRKTSKAGDRRTMTLEEEHDNILEEADELLQGLTEDIEAEELPDDELPSGLEDNDHHATNVPFDPALTPGTKVKKLLEPERSSWGAEAKPGQKADEASERARNLQSTSLSTLGISDKIAQPGASESPAGRQMSILSDGNKENPEILDLAVKDAVAKSDLLHNKETTRGPAVGKSPKELLDAEYVVESGAIEGFTEQSKVDNDTKKRLPSILPATSPVFDGFQSYLSASDAWNPDLSITNKQMLDDEQGRDKAIRKTSLAPGPLPSPSTVQVEEGKEDASGLVPGSVKTLDGRLSGRSRQTSQAIADGQKSSLQDYPQDDHVGVKPSDHDVHIMGVETHASMEANEQPTSIKGQETTTIKVTSGLKTQTEQPESAKATVAASELNSDRPAGPFEPLPLDSQQERALSSQGEDSPDSIMDFKWVSKVGREEEQAIMDKSPSGAKTKDRALSEMGVTQAAEGVETKKGDKIVGERAAPGGSEPPAESSVLEVRKPPSVVPETVGQFCGSRSSSPLSEHDGEYDESDFEEKVVASVLVNINNQRVSEQEDVELKKAIENPVRIKLNVKDRQGSTSKRQGVSPAANEKVFLRFPFAGQGTKGNNDEPTASRRRTSGSSEESQQSASSQPRLRLTHKNKPPEEAIATGKADGERGNTSSESSLLDGGRRPFKLYVSQKRKRSSSEGDLEPVAAPPKKKKTDKPKKGTQLSDPASDGDRPQAGSTEGETMHNRGQNTLRQSTQWHEGATDSDCPICHITLAQIKEIQKKSGYRCNLSDEQILSKHVELCSDQRDSSYEGDSEMDEDFGGVGELLVSPSVDNRKDRPKLPSYLAKYSQEFISGQLQILEEVHANRELANFESILDMDLTDVAVFKESIDNAATGEEALAAEENAVFAMHAAQTEYVMLEEVIKVRRAEQGIEPKPSRGKMANLKKKKARQARNPLEPEDPVAWEDKKEADLYGYVYDPAPEKRGRQDPIMQQSNKYSIRGRELRSRNRNYELKTVPGYEYRDPRTANMEPKLTRRRKQTEDKEKPASRDVSAPESALPGLSTAASRSAASTPAGDAPVKRKPGRPRGSGLFNSNNQVAPPILKAKPVDAAQRHPLSQSVNARHLDGLAVLSPLNNSGVPTSSGPPLLQPTPLPPRTLKSFDGASDNPSALTLRLKYGKARADKVQDIISRPGTATPGGSTPAPSDLGPISLSAPASPGRFYPPANLHNIRHNFAENPMLADSPSPEMAAGQTSEDDHELGDTDSESPRPARGRGRGGRPRGRARGSRGRGRGSLPRAPGARGPGRPRGSRAARGGIPVVPHVNHPVVKTEEAIASVGLLQAHEAPAPAMGGDTTEAEQESVSDKRPNLSLKIPGSSAEPQSTVSPVSPHSGISMEDGTTKRRGVRGKTYKTPTSVAVGEGSERRTTQEEEFRAAQNAELGKRKRTKTAAAFEASPQKRRRGNRASTGSTVADEDVIMANAPSESAGSPAETRKSVPPVPEE